MESKKRQTVAPIIPENIIMAVSEEFGSLAPETIFLAIRVMIQKQNRMENAVDNAEKKLVISGTCSGFEAKRVKILPTIKKIGAPCPSGVCHQQKCQGKKLAIYHAIAKCTMTIQLIDRFV